MIESKVCLWSWKLLSSETLSLMLLFFYLVKRGDIQLMIFSYSNVMKTPGFGQKTEKYFVAYLYPELSLSQLDGVGKNLGYLHYLLHPRGVTFEDAWNLILLKMNKVLSGLFCWTTENRVCREVGNWNYCKLGALTFTCFWSILNSVCIILDISLRISCNFGV